MTINIHTAFSPYSEAFVCGQEVWCDQETEGGGWTVMLWRKEQPTQIDFRRNWQSYSEGFGSADGEYWIGGWRPSNLEEEEEEKEEDDMKG